MAKRSVIFGPPRWDVWRAPERLLCAISAARSTPHSDHIVSRAVGMIQRFCNLAVSDLATAYIEATAAILVSSDTKGPEDRLCLAHARASVPWQTRHREGSRSSWLRSESPTARACPWADAASRLLSPEPESSRSNPASNKVTCEPGLRQADAPYSDGDRSSVLKATH
jgi:hypothetical protein